MILFRDSDQTLVITEDFRVSRMPKDLHGSRPDKIKYFNFIFQLQSNMKRLTWKSSKKNWISPIVHFVGMLCYIYSFKL